MFQFLLLFVSFIVGSFGQNCGWPNGTDTALNWWYDPSNFCTVYSADAQDANGNHEYPIKLTQPVVAVLNITNGGPTASHVQLDINILEYGGFLGCNWTMVPTFGLLNNLDACKFTACPIMQGNQLAKITIDFSAFQAIVNLLNDKTPYQLDVKLTNKDNNLFVLAHVQARVLT